MAFQAVPDVAEIAIQYTLNTRNPTNVLHAHIVGGYNLTDLAALASAVDASVGTDWLPDQSQDCAYQQTVVTGLDEINDLQVTDNASAAAGGIAANAMPGNVTVSVKRASALTGRSARGRLYWIGMPVTKLQANENLIFQAAADDIEDAVDKLRIAIAATAWTPAIVSRFTEGVQRGTGVFFEWTDTTIVNLNVDSQRRRLIR